MLRFMCVGDSMTIGSAGEHTWRYRLWKHLCATLGGPFAFVGPHTELYEKAVDAAVSQDYADPGFPAAARRHLAGWGRGWFHMAPLIGETVARERADILLVSLGLIDLGFYTEATGTAENMVRFVAAAREANPSIRMVLLPVIPNALAAHDAAFAAQVTRFNALFARAVAHLDRPASPLRAAAPPESYDIRTDTYDGTHPNAAGEHKLAAAFAEVLYEEWDVGGPYVLPDRLAHSSPVASRRARVLPPA